MVIAIDCVPGFLEFWCAACQRLALLDTTQLELGAEQHGHFHADLIQLPACACGAQSYLLRTWEPPVAGGAADPHERQRHAINALAQRLARHKHATAAAERRPEAMGVLPFVRYQGDAAKEVSHGA